MSIVAPTPRRVKAASAAPPTKSAVRAALNCYSRRLGELRTLRAKRRELREDPALTEAAEETSAEFAATRAALREAGNALAQALSATVAASVATGDSFTDAIIRAIDPASKGVCP